MPRSISDPLPSWNDGTAKRAIMDFVRRVSTDDSRDYVPENERIAVFDNDGTLWCEMPVPVHSFFAADRLRALAPEHPEWRTTQPFQAVLEGNREALGAAGVKGILELVVATTSSAWPRWWRSRWSGSCSGSCRESSWKPPEGLQSTGRAWVGS